MSPAPNMDPIFKDVAKLREVLEHEDRQPTKMLLSEFEKFLPLFQTDNSRTAMRESGRKDRNIKILTDQYRNRVDIYKEVWLYLTPQDKAPFIILPPIFLTINPILRNEKGEAAVALYRKDGGSDIPKHAGRAEMAIFEAIKDAQQDPVYIQHCIEERKRTHRCIDAFMNLRGGPPVTPQTPNSSSISGGKPGAKTVSEPPKYQPLSDDDFL